MGGFIARLCRESPLMLTVAKHAQARGRGNAFHPLLPPPRKREWRVQRGKAPLGLRSEKSFLGFAEALTNSKGA